ncbi:MAG: HAD-IIA family hydrolase [Clostridia bacterium]|nr:HAD-IIA family hydrolase [Clostridia bacterium]
MTLRELIETTKLYLFDLDGTLYLSEDVFPFSAELLKEIKARGARYMYITNNSSKSGPDYVAKMTRLGIESTEDEFISSAFVTTKYMSENYADKCIYLCGTQSLKNQFLSAGLCVTDSTEKADCIVIGSDTELTFKKIDDVCRLLYEKPNITYIATNPDPICPTEYGNMPDCGAIVDMIFTATGKMPIYIGKPSPLMAEFSMQICGCEREETVVIGDRLDTDIDCGLAADTKTLLVYSGFATPEMYENAEKKPDLAIADCGVLLQVMKKMR